MSFASPCLLLALADRSGGARARVVVRPATRALRGRVHEPRPARGGRRRPRRPGGSWVPLALFLLALAAASTALARPRATVSVPAEPRDRRAARRRVGLDARERREAVAARCGAARDGDFSQTRAEEVKVGLVSFSTGPNVLVPPTTDRDAPQRRHRPARPRGRNGDRRRAGALRCRSAKASVRRAPRGKDGKLPGAIVLLSDGAQTRGTLTPLQGADRARERRHPRVHGRARDEPRHARVRAVRRWLRLAAVRARAQPALPRAAGPGDARGDRPRDRRPDLPRRVRDRR